MSMQSDIKTISEETATEVVTTTTEATEVEQITSTQMLTEEASKPHNTGVTPTGVETRIEGTEEAALKAAALNNTLNPKIT